MDKEEEQAKQDAEHLLSRYKFYQRKAKGMPTLQSPVSDGMPTGSITGNSQENKNIRYIDDPARRYLQVCNEMLNKMAAIEDDDIYANLLYMKYLEGGHTSQDIANIIGVARRGLYNYLNKALSICGQYQEIEELKKLEIEYKELNKG